jgi:hypothetical protein
VAGTALASYPVGKGLGREAALGLLTGSAVAFLVVTTSFYTLTWAFDKSRKVFMQTFVVGLLGRLAIIGATVMVVSQIEGLDLVTTTVSLLAFYGLLTFLEIRFFNSLLKALKEGRIGG